MSIVEAELYEALVESAPDAILLIDSEGSIRLANAQAEVLFGYPRAELLGAPVEILLPEHYRSRHVVHREGYFSDPRHRAMGAGLTLAGLRKDGSEFPVAISLSAIRTAKGVFAAAAIRDVSEREAADEKLARYAAELERSNEELNRFAYVASHDLQEPLRKVMNFSGRLRDRFAEQLGERGQDYLERMNSAAERMSVLVNDLLDLSRVSTTTGAFAEVDLGKITAEVLSDLEGRIEDSGGRVDVDPLPSVEADATQMRQLLQNLIGNALKYRKPECAPTVHVRGGIEGETLVLRVADDGIGFEQAAAARIFQPFERLVGRCEYEGTGIGLALCKRIVDRHGGSIEATSEPGVGSTFIARLPLRQNPARGGAQKPKS